MKKMYFAALTIGTVLLAACGGQEAAEETEATYNLDAKSTLNWTGKYVADGHTHTGSVNITEGSMTYKGDEFVSGEFKIDLTSIKDTDLDAPMNDTLDSHLKSMYFFDTAKNTEATVTVTEVTAKEIKATISLMGKEVKAVMPLNVKKDDKSVSAKGKFDIDFKDLGLMGFQPAPGDPADAHVETVFSFEMNLMLKK